MHHLTPAQWAGKHVFVTGHTGFKGSWLVRVLYKLGAKITGFSLPEAVSVPAVFDKAKLGELCTDLRGDICDLAAITAAIQTAKPDIVIHMAAQPIVRLSYREPVPTMMANIMGTAHVLEAIRLTPGIQAALIVTSDKCYENREQVWAYRECDAMGGADPYSASKGATEVVASAYARSYFKADGCAITMVRAGNVIGGGDWAANRLIPDLARAAVAGTPVEIRSPKSVRPWQHVLDPLHGYLMAAERLLTTRTTDHEGWNFGPNPGEELPVGDVVRAFQAAWGGAPEVQFGNADVHEAGMLRVDTTKAKVRLGWRPLLDNAAAITSAGRWYKAFSNGADARTLIDHDIKEIMGL